MDKKAVYKALSSFIKQIWNNIAENLESDNNSLNIEDLNKNLRKIEIIKDFNLNSDDDSDLNSELTKI